MSDRRQLACPICDRVLLVKNLARHVLTIHPASPDRHGRENSQSGTAASGSALPISPLPSDKSRPVSTVTEVELELPPPVLPPPRADLRPEDGEGQAYTVTSPQPTSSLPHTGTRAVDPDVATSDAYRRYIFTNAATDLLDQHHLYDEPGLLKYLADVHPEVPANQRLALVIGAMTGGERAAKVSFWTDKHWRAPTRHHRVKAAKADCALSNWIMGLMRSRFSSSFHRPTESSPRVYVDEYSDCVI